MKRPIHFTKNWNLKEINIEQIHKRFYILFLNRLSKAKDPIIKNLPEEPTFTPTLSKNSKNMGIIMNKRIAQHLKNFGEKGTKNEFDVYKILEFKNMKNKEIKEKLKAENEHNIMAHCTFHPSISNTEGKKSKENEICKIKY